MKKDQNPKLGRVGVVYGMTFLALSSLILRLGYLQIVNGANFRAKANNTMMTQLPVLPSRGWIYDTNGTYLAYDQPSFSVALTRLSSKSQNLSAIAAQLAPVFKMSVKNLEATMSKNPEETQIRILENATDAQVSYVVEHQSDLPGIHVVEDPQRVYRYGDLAGHLLGYVHPPTQAQIDKYSTPTVKYMADQWVGQDGVEEEYETYLQGSVGDRVVEINSLGVPVKEYGLDPSPIAGDNIQLTLDAHLQALAQQIVVDELAAVKKQYGYTPKDAEAVMLDAKTGGVLAMVSYPYYDPNWFVTSKAYTEHQAYINDANLAPMFNNVLQSFRAPGSTVKPVNVLAGLESHTITPSTTIADPGYAWVGTYKANDWQPGGHGIVDPVKAIKESCDTFMYDLGMWMAKWHSGPPAGESLSTWNQTDRVKGLNTLYHWEWLFGLGQKTGIDLPNELSGHFYTDAVVHGQTTIERYNLQQSMTSIQTTGKYPNTGLLYDNAFAAIGQMQQFTPMELAQYVMTIAENGKKLQPHVLKAILSPSGKVVKTFQPVVEADLKLNPEDLNVVKTGMWQVVNQPFGTAYGVFYGAPYQAAGKTGTAEYYDQGVKKDISEFVAYAPANNPQVVIAVRVPGGGESGQTAVPMGRQLLDAYFQEHHEFFPPSQWTDTQVPPNWTSMMAYTIAETTDAAKP